MNSFLLSFIDSPIKIILIGLLISFWMTYRSIPVVVYLSFAKNLIVIPNKRSSHFKNTPNLGGIGIFIGTVFTTNIIGSMILNQTQFSQLAALNAALILLFFAGVKDDIHTLSPLKKLIIQIFASLIVLISFNIRIKGFYGIFGINELPLIASYFLTIIVFIVLTNAYNLIDGIDGLAGSIALIIFIFYGYIFFETNNFYGLILSVTITGSIVAFLFFNLAKSRRKIFMGDTGSMFVGFLIVYVSIIILNTKNLPLNLNNNISIVVLALLSFPILDTIRIFTIRILSGKNPLKADKNHIHHRLLKLGFSHIKSTLLISIFVILNVALSILTINLDITFHFFVVAIFSFFCTLIPYFIENTDGKWKLRIPIITKKKDKKVV
jgi:UDP-N-acetylmuramyl pentapeptide phosphotransferase/UDP-N-acetylglucosamine-1-phosphate transferase